MVRYALLANSSGTVNLGEVKVEYPSGIGVKLGAENQGTITAPITAGAIYRLQVKLEPPTLEGIRQAHHYRLGFTYNPPPGVSPGPAPIAVGTNSPSFRYFEAERQAFHFNIDTGESFKLAVLVENSGSMGTLQAPGVGAPQATSVTLEVYSDFPNNLLLSVKDQPLPFVVDIPDAPSGTLHGLFRTNGHYRLEKQSGSDRGIYFEACPPMPVYIGQVGDSEEFFSEVLLTNPSPDLPASGLVRFLDDDGDPLPIGIAPNLEGTVPLGGGISDPENASSVNFNIPPRGAVTIETDGSGELMVGSAVVISDSRVEAVIRWNGQQGVSGAVGESVPLTGFITPVRWRPGGINTGIAMHNADPETETFDLMLLTEGGEELATTSVTLKRGGHVAKFVDELFPVDVLTAAGSSSPQSHFSGGDAFIGVLIGVMAQEQPSSEPQSTEGADAIPEPAGFAPRGWAFTALEVGGTEGTFNTVPVTSFTATGGGTIN